jgi:hypothetical protein
MFLSIPWPPKEKMFNQQARWQDLKAEIICLTQNNKKGLDKGQ